MKTTLGGIRVAMPPPAQQDTLAEARKGRLITSMGQPGKQGIHVDIDYPMFRLADAYLIYAEAHLRGGGGDAAFEEQVAVDVVVDVVVGHRVAPVDVLGARAIPAQSMAKYASVASRRTSSALL